jgi:hypothetical protein
VTAGGSSFIQAQVVDGGSGRASQHDRDLVFGLGQYTGPAATIHWPTGRIQSASLTLDALNVISDDSPVVLDGTVGANLIYHFSGEVDWRFHWETSHLSTAASDLVSLSAKQLCMPPLSELTPSTTGVSHSITQTESGTYEHELIWYDVPCVAHCSVTYKVASGIDTFTSQSTDHTLQIPVCGYSQ